MIRLAKAYISDCRFSVDSNKILILIRFRFLKSKFQNYQKRGFAAEIQNGIELIFVSATFYFVILNNWEGGAMLY